VPLRWATEDDEPELRRLDLACWSPLVTPGPEPARDAPFLTPSRPAEEVLVAAEPDRLVGYLVLQQQIPLPSHRHVLVIMGLGVDPAARQLGVARRLLDRALREAVAGGAAKVSLRVLAGNTAARRLYESHGFVVEGVLRDEFRIDGRSVDDVLMAWFAPADSG
jgi:ribosomal protein S18 acetylase RimI-like enzyme